VLYIFDNDEGINRYERLLEYQSKESDYSVKINTLMIFADNFLTSFKYINEKFSSENGLILMLDFSQPKTYLNYLREYRKIITNKNNHHLILVNLGLNQEDLTEFYNNQLKIIQFSLIDFQNSKTMRLINDLYQGSTNKVLGLSVYFKI
jgi:hypothetical protein